MKNFIFCAVDVSGGPGYFSDGSFITVRWGHPHSTYAQGGLILAIFVRKHNVDYSVSKLPTFRFCIVYFV